MLSLGAGVQSTTLALMAAHGEIGPMPDCAIFADTGWEPKAVYEHLAWLQSPNVLPFPVHIVSAGDLRADLLAGARGERWASIPAFTRNVTPAGTELPVYDEDEDGNRVVHGLTRTAREPAARRASRYRYGVVIVRARDSNAGSLQPIRPQEAGVVTIGRRRATARCGIVPIG